MHLKVITHADGSRVSIAIICVCDFVCVKTAESKISKLGTGLVHRDTLPTN